MANGKTNTFYGNKSHPLNDGGGYYCGVRFNAVATGEHIVERRKAMSLSQMRLVEALDLAGLLRISVTTLGKYERGDVKHIAPEHIQALCIFFGCSHDELVVYSYREIDSERDQLAHLSLLSSTSACFLHVLVFVNLFGLWEFIIIPIPVTLTLRPFLLSCSF